MARRGDRAGRERAQVGLPDLLSGYPGYDDRDIVLRTERNAESANSWEKNFGEISQNPFKPSSLHDRLNPQSRSFHGRDSGGVAAASQTAQSDGQMARRLDPGRRGRCEYLFTFARSCLPCA